MSSINFDLSKALTNRFANSVLSKCKPSVHESMGFGKKMVFNQYDVLVTYAAGTGGATVNLHMSEEIAEEYKKNKAEHEVTGTSHMKWVCGTDKEVDDAVNDVLHVLTLLD